MSRTPRALALPLCVLTLIMLAIPPGAAAAAPARDTQAPGFYRLHVGNYELTVISDGTAPRPVDEIMSKPEKVREIMARDHQALPIDLSINVFLINTGPKLILVDTGAGELFGPHSGGRLLENLRAAGYQPEQIDAILLTHIHADHSGGLSIGGKRVFNNAQVFVDKRDPALWLSAAAEKAAPDSKKRIFRQSHATVDPYVASGQLHTFDGATQLFPGIRSIPAYGHTPGHTAYMVESQGQRMLLWGDTIHLAEVQFTNPEVTVEYDVEPHEASKTREALLKDASRMGYLVGGAHISFPGLGHVSSERSGYGWIPIPYSSGP